MTLRDLTEKQIKEMQKVCLADFKTSEPVIVQNNSTPWQIWQKAFSRGLVAGLGHASPEPESQKGSAPEKN